MEYKTAHPDIYPLLKENARKNRKNMTMAEHLLWEALRKKRMEGHPVLRQHIIGDYIVDFLSRDDGLIIEVDGGYHSEPRQQEYDSQRADWLEQQGYHILRFSNEEVMNDIENVIKTIELYFK